MNVDPSISCNVARIAALKQLLGREFPALVNNFRANTCASLTALRTQMREGRFAQARETAHRLRSALSQFGLLHAARIAEEFEHHREDENAEALITLLEEKYVEALPKLNAAIGDA